ncbi:hypothetical protein [Vitiosangium sp. GDMCC 1.1324]|uniref:hypothetical protein n=1 Tax=Vitiosangium sp. (strain GDMCC 1.1324) TaxID=2138576 RepID=UPI001E4154F0|nr:hypothetical protein [Vitiosangium sp. GDMCC 1.1324]
MPSTVHQSVTESKVIDSSEVRLGLNSSGSPLETSPFKLAVETQIGEITDEMRARIALVRPILNAILHALQKERMERLGGVAKITLADLAREYREGSGDCGICFEYAVHDAICRGDRLIAPLINEVLEDFCGITGNAKSILFGAEKAGRISLIEPAEALLTEESRIWVGNRGQPAKLKQYIKIAEKAFHQPEHRNLLPRSIRGIWRADLFLGSATMDKWVATTLKINARDLSGDAGLRIGIYPESRNGERPYLDESKNLIICPLPYNAGFMEIFYKSFLIVRQFLAADARLPREVALPDSVDRYVASELVARRAYAILDVIEALAPVAQPSLVESTEVGTFQQNTQTQAIAPIAKTV